MRTPARSYRAALAQHAGQPIIAIGSGGGVTKVNGPALRLLDRDRTQLEGPNLGVLVASFLERHPRAGGIASLSLPAATNDETAAALAIVLSAQGSAPTEPSREEKPATADATDDHRLADFIAHELRSPLGSIQHLARILRQRQESISAAEQAAVLQSVETDAERALVILEALLNLARQRHHVGRTVASSIPLHAVIRKIATAHQQRNAERRILLTGDSPLYAAANSVGFELALTNLLNNAEKYAPAGIAIEIATHHEGDRVTILVVNEGVALPAARYRKLWDIYASGPDPEVVITGSGIGLALCKELIETMGGRVWGGPRSRGGSAFAITLPAAEEISARELAAGPAQTGPVA